MSLENHPLVACVTRAGEAYRSVGPVAQLQAEVSAAMSALEGDVPREVQDAMFELEADIDSARFSLDEPQRAAHITESLETFKARLVSGAEKRLGAGNELRIVAFEQLFVIDGGPKAEAPEPSGPPVVAGPQAIYVAGRVPSDASTSLRVGPPRDPGPLLFAYAGSLETPELRVRVTNHLDEVLGTVPVSHTESHVRVFVSDMTEPDEILVILEPRRN